MEEAEGRETTERGDDGTAEGFQEYRRHERRELREQPVALKVPRDDDEQDLECREHGGEPRDQADVPSQRPADERDEHPHCRGSLPSA